MAHTHTFAIEFGPGLCLRGELAPAMIISEKIQGEIAQVLLYGVMK